MKTHLLIGLVTFFFSTIILASPTKPVWIFSVTAPWLTAAGDSNYGENHTTGNVTTNPSLQNHFNANFKMSFLYMNDNRTTQISYANYVTHWNTESLINGDFGNNTPYSYHGTNSLINFTFTHGYNINFTKDLLVNIHAGFSYDILRSTTDLSGTPTTQPNRYLKQGISDFSGFGPSIGFTLKRTLFSYFTLSNQANLNLSYGEAKLVSMQADNQHVASSQGHHILVPGIDMTIALGYAQVVHKQYIGVDAGMLFKQLFNVVNTHNAASNQYQDVAFYGPFLRLRYGF